MAAGPEFEMPLLRNAQFTTDAEGEAVAESCRQHPIDIAGFQAGTLDRRLRCAHRHRMQALSQGGRRQPPGVVKGRAIVQSAGAYRSPAWRRLSITIEQDGSCAIAVHKYHWFTRRLTERPDADNYFTGAYVRNPLTGDLMSVWVADWVKPDFGTGAVLVNPAHNKTDLEFARQVGLPIRFALSLDAQVDEHSMPTPPVLKAGFAIRTGWLDGKPAMDVHNNTINVLLRKGSARLHEDKRIPGEVIARIEQTSPDRAELYWSPQNGTFHPDATQGLPVRVDFSPSFQAAVTTVTHRPDHLQVDAAIQKKNIGVLAGLIFDLGGLEAFVPLTLLESVEYAGSRSDGDPAVDLALLVGEEPEKVLVIRKALIDQIDSFLNGCQKLSTRLGENGALPPAQVTTALTQGDPVSAFRTFYQWQKQMVANDEVIDQSAYTSILSTFGLESA